MPRIAIDSHEPEKTTLLKFLKQWVLKGLNQERKESRVDEYVVRFGNGRHRTEFFRVKGVGCMPFEARERHADLLIIHCGCQCHSEQ